MAIVDVPPFDVDLNGEIPNPHARFLRTDYNYNVDEASVASGLRCDDPSRADQSMKDECDINTIIERFGLNGELPQGVRMPFNAEFDEVLDYQTALNRVMEADAKFMEFPANVRERFHNNPAELIAFAMDPANQVEAKALGLMRPEWEPPAPPAPAVAAPAQGST